MVNCGTKRAEIIIGKFKKMTRVQVQNGRIAQNQAEKQQKLKWSQISIESLKCPW